MCEHHHEPQPHAPRGDKRRRIWEIDARYLCTVIGTCLSLADIQRVGRQLARRGKLELPRGLKPYELHGAFVRLAQDRNPAGRVLNKLLEARYGGVVRAYRAAQSVEDLRGMWRGSVAAGEVPGACWAVMTHPRCDHVLLEEIFGEIHMMSHLLGATQNAQARHLDALETRAAALEIRADEAHRLEAEAKAQAKTISAQEARIAELEVALAEAQARTAVLERGEARRRLEGQLERLEAREADHRAAAESREARIIELERGAEALRLRAEAGEALAEQRAVEMEALEALLERHAQPLDEGEDPCEACPAKRLCGQRVLYLGGHPSLAHHYRQVVEWQGGELIYHDGGQEHRVSRLDEVLSGVQVVVCPVNAVSHNACLKAKHLCKLNAKRFVPLRSSGVASLARAIDTLH